MELEIEYLLTSQMYEQRLSKLENNRKYNLIHICNQASDGFIAFAYHFSGNDLTELSSCCEEDHIYQIGSLSELGFHELYCTVLPIQMLPVCTGQPKSDFFSEAFSDDLD